MANIYEHNMYNVFSLTMNNRIIPLNVLTISYYIIPPLDGFVNWIIDWLVTHQNVEFQIAVNLIFDYFY